jgi:hypothetical protein
METRYADTLWRVWRSLAGVCGCGGGGGVALQEQGGAGSGRELAMEHEVQQTGGMKRVA